MPRINNNTELLKKLLEKYYETYADHFVLIQNAYDDKNYRQMLDLADNKPIALGEVGRMPSVDKLREQPRWLWFMSWGDIPEYGSEFKNVFKVYKSENVITLDELPWVDVKNPRLHFPYIK